MRLKFYAEGQGVPVREAYFASIPTEVFDRLMEIRHSLKHGTLTYSHPASEALQDWFEYRLSKIAIELKNAKDGTEKERLQARLDGERMQKALIGFGQARVAGFTAPQEFAPMLAHIHTNATAFAAVAKFIHLDVIADHPLEQCPDPD